MGLDRISLQSSASDIRLLVNRYDADKDGKLGFWEFCNSLLPIDEVLRDEVERRKAVWELSE